MNVSVAFPDLFDRAPIGLTVLDRQGRVVAANPAVAEFFGCAPKDLLGVRLVTAFTFPSDAAREAELFLELVDGKRTRYELEKRYERPDGRIAWANLRVALPREENGRPGELALHALYDVTADRLATARRQREAKLDALARLATEILQQLNRLMVATLGSSQLLLAETPTTDHHRELGQNVHDTVDHALAVSRRLVEFCGRQVPNLTLVDLNALLTRMQPRLRSLVGNDVELVIGLKPSLGHVRADAAQMERALYFLAANGKDAMPSGGRLTITTGTALLNEEGPGRRSEKPISYLTITVSDTGRGMDAKTMDRLFEPFFTTKERGRGMGLSLAIAHGIVRQAGGFIDVVSEIGKGTAFTIYLPRTSDTVPDLIVPSALSETARDRQTVLLVEDDDETRSRVRTALRAEGYQVLEARYVGEALLLCLRHHGPIHVVLADVVLQRVSPREFIDQVVAVRPAARFVFLGEAPPDEESLPNLAWVPRSAPTEVLVNSLRAALEGHCQSAGTSVPS